MTPSCHRSQRNHRHPQSESMAFSERAPLIIDSFAGGGGASTGIEMALGRSPDVAINHDPVAIAMHAVNHPCTLHLTNDIWGVDPMSVRAGEPIGLMWASPDCKHFSKAKGAKPANRNIRDLAWVIIDWAEKRKPEVICVENVEEFLTWGPVGNDGKPINELAGQTFEGWVRRLRKAGYRVEWRISRACDYGAPTIRRRLLIIASRIGKPVWPKPTHGDPKSLEVQRGKLKPWRTAAECIDFSLPCPSIFDTAHEIRAKYGVAAVRPLAKNTMARVAAGVRRYVLDAAEPFLVICNHGGDHFRGGSISDPFATVTAARDAHGLIIPVLTYAQHGGSNRSPAIPLHTVTASPKDQNAVIAPTLMSLKGTYRRDSEVTAPHPAVLAGGFHSALIAPFLAQHNKARTGVNPGRAADEPISTVIASGSQQSVVAPFVVKYYGAGIGATVDSPMPTVTVKDRFGFLSQELSAPPLEEKHKARARQIAEWMRSYGLWDDREFVTITVRGVDLVIVDIGMRMLTPRELFNAQGFPSDYEIERDSSGRIFSKADQVGRAGNSVSPPWAAAHIVANCPHLMRQREAAE